MANKVQHKRELTGAEKAAIFFITIGPERSAKVMKLLPDKMIEKITFEISNLDKVDQAVRDDVLSEFKELNDNIEYYKEGGVDYARDVLTKALGAQKAKDIMDTSAQLNFTRKPFTLARRSDPLQLSKIIATEHPQTIALILCFLQQDKAAQILVNLPDELQREVSFRIATMNKTSPLVIKRVEKILDEKLSNMTDNNFESYGGVVTIANILNAVNRSTEKHILEGIDNRDRELAESIKLNMFIFEDIVKLNNTSIQRVLREVDNADLIVALKGVSDELMELIMQNLSKRASETLKEDIELLGPVRLSLVEEKQHKIVGIVRRLEETGEIHISRGGEDAVIV